MGKKNKVTLNEHNVTNTADDFEDLSSDMKENLKDFRDKFRIDIVKYDHEKFEFDMIGIPPAIANAVRRVLISDVPTMAIDRVHMLNNTSLMQDEVLAHRLGLIPLKADPRLFEYRTEEESEGTDQDSLQFELKIKCSRNVAAGNDKTLPDDLYIDHKVYSKHLKWIPIGGQEDLYKEEEIGPIHDDILIMKLRPGHEIELRAFAYKGVGRDHAKFSPVATAHYRQLPEIRILRSVAGEKARRLATCFSPGVIGIKKNKEGTEEAYVIDARYDSSSRNVFRYDDLKDCVEMTRVSDHFIFTVESTGALSPDILFIEALKTLKKKCKELSDQIP
ncbi:DNA-directed RNA polymerases I and III subunit RPAC1 isoform X1 [Bemisia tabaci]|uniref:DNA-directed RNA polymerases I and III subunit RPAC1 isoform X1 n=1 Tax=Bemisia tabaci TaxID=7038 RepID=UPI003B28AFE1